MAKLIELQEAAKMLGITPDELTEMRSRNEIFGYRDGSTWKFKEQEIERVARELEVDLKDVADQAAAVDNDDSQESIELDLDDIDISADLDDEDSILVSENELGQSDDATSSTIIGKPDPLIDGGGSSGGSAINLSDVSDSGSELRLAADSTLGSSPDVLGGEEKKGPSDTANLDKESSELKLEADSGSFDFNLDDDEISLDAGSEIDLDDAAQASSSGFGSAIDLDLDDDELVLGSSSDVTAGGAGDSGINLSNPADSGLSLEQPLDLDAGSGADSLELGEDDMIVLDDDVGAEAPTDLEADNDFLLTPVEEADDESSGSQIIDLDSAEFDESASTLLADNASPMDAMDEEVTFDALDDGADDGLLEVESAGAAAAVGGATLASAGRAAAAQEAQYSIWNVLSLGVIVLLLSVTGMMMLDLINNIWSWDKGFAFSSVIMETILSVLGSS